jgi:hypothetical protein
MHSEEGHGNQRLSALAICLHGGMETSNAFVCTEGDPRASGSTCRLLRSTTVYCTLEALAVVTTIEERAYLQGLLPVTKTSMSSAGRLGGMKVASTGSADNVPAAGAAQPAVVKPTAQPTASRGSRGKQRKPVYVDSERWETLI